MRVIFMGTPDFVIPVLSPLVEAPDIDVVAVYTPPDRPRGRGRSVDMPPVKRYALEQGLTVCQPAGFRGAEAREQLSAFRPDVMVVAAYGRLLPKPVLDAAPGGCLNLHPSLLPKYRGPSPVATAIRYGLTATGVTLMLLDEGMDTGPIVAQREFPLSPTDTAGSLTAALFQAGADLLMDNVRVWVNGDIPPRPQDDGAATVTNKLERADGQADWQLSALELERLHRAYTPWPGLFTHWDGQGLKLLDVAAVEQELAPPTPPGTVVPVGNNDIPLGVVTGEGVLGLKTVQLEGRRGVTAAAFKQGYPGFIGSRLSSPG
jgi:methionyl-tRNA formyltransferase